MIARAIPYAGAGAIGIGWESIPGWLAIATLALCVALVYMDARGTK